MVSMKTIMNRNNTLIALEDFISYFNNYVEPYLMVDEIASSLRIKKEHTFQVLSLGQQIMKDFSEQLHFPLQLACLFHDIGRFEQMKIYKTFHDPISCNHALLSMKVLKNNQVFKDISKDVRELAFTGIALHNRFIFPTKLPKNHNIISLAVRDADKIDILRVMVENFVNAKGDSDTLFLHVKDEPTYTPEILEAFFAKSAIRYSDLRYVNDFRILLCGWLNDINYSTSFRIIKEKNYFAHILKDLPNTDKLSQLKQEVNLLLNS